MLQLKTDALVLFDECSIWPVTVFSLSMVRTSLVSGTNLMCCVSGISQSSIFFVKDSQTESVPSGLIKHDMK